MPNQNKSKVIGIQNLNQQIEFYFTVYKLCIIFNLSNWLHTGQNSLQSPTTAKISDPKGTREPNFRKRIRYQEPSKLTLPNPSQNEPNWLIVQYLKWLIKWIPKLKSEFKANLKPNRSFEPAERRERERESTFSFNLQRHEREKSDSDSLQAEASRLERFSGNGVESKLRVRESYEMEKIISSEMGGFIYGTIDDSQWLERETERRARLGLRSGAERRRAARVAFWRGEKARDFFIFFYPKISAI